MKKFLLKIVGKKDNYGKLSDSKKFAQEQFMQLLKRGLKFPVSSFHL